MVARGGGRFAQELVGPLEKAPAVQVAVPLLYQYAVLSTGTKRIQINGVGTVLSREQMLRAFVVVTGRLLQNDGEIVLEESLAQSAGITSGDDVKLLTWRGVQHVQVVGLIRPLEVWAFTQGGLAYLNLNDWQWMCKAPGKIDALQILLKPSADKEQTLASLARTLPPELQLRSAREAAWRSNVALSAFEYALQASRLLTMIVAVLLILNTFLMNVTERRGELAVLRLIGATRRQVTVLLLSEGALLGTVGATLGLPVGWVLSRWLAKGVETAFFVSLDNQEVAPGLLLSAFALGPGLGVIATLLPARRAGQIGPLEWLRARAVAAEEKTPWRQPALGALLVLMSTIGMYLAWIHIAPKQMVLWLAVCFLLGLLLFFPWYCGPPTPWPIGCCASSGLWNSSWPIARRCVRLDALC